MRYNSEVLGKGKFNWTNFIPYAASKLSTTIMEIHLWIWIERESGRRRLQSNKVEKDTYYFLRGNGTCNKTSWRQRPSYPSLKHLKLARSLVILLFHILMRFFHINFSPILSFQRKRTRSRALSWWQRKYMKDCTSEKLFDFTSTSFYFADKKEKRDELKVDEDNILPAASAIWIIANVSRHFNDVHKWALWNYNWIGNESHE